MQVRVESTDGDGSTDNRRLRVGSPRAGDARNEHVLTKIETNNSDAEKGPLQQQAPGRQRATKGIGDQRATTDRRIHAFAGRVQRPMSDEEPITVAHVGEATGATLQHEANGDGEQVLHGEFKQSCGGKRVRAGARTHADT